MASTDNKIEIKFIIDYREFLLSKIESLKGSLNHIASSFGNEISSSIDEFSKRINSKLKNIDERFTKNTEELEALRTELLSKKFDEANFNNVSMLRTLDKTISERDLKIKELESRIRYLEGNVPVLGNANASIVKVKKEPPAPIKQKPEAIIITSKSKEINNRQELVEVPVEVSIVVPKTDDKFKDASRVQDADGDVIIAVSAKKSRSKTDKKNAQPVDLLPNTVALEASSANDESAVVEEKPKKPIRKIKKASKVEKEDEIYISIPNPEPEPSNEPSRDVDVDCDDDATDAQLLADEEALRLAQEEAEEAERMEEAERLEEEQRLEEAERVAKAVAELEKKKKPEIIKKQIIIKKDSNDTKEPTKPKKITSKPTSVPIVPTMKPTLSSSKTKETLKIKQGYPDKLPELEDLDVITVDANDYYCDKNNQCVYQIINDDNIFNINNNNN